VAELITISAPKSIGDYKYGVAKVLSATTRILCYKKLINNTILILSLI
jgi:hypothetical protein